MVFWYYRRLVNSTVFNIAAKGVQVVHDSLRRPEWRAKSIGNQACSMRLSPHRRANSKGNPGCAVRKGEIL